MAISLPWSGQKFRMMKTIQWRHNGRDSVLNHQPHGCLLNRLFVYSDADQRKHQSSASLAFVRGIHRGAVNSPHKWPVTRKKVSIRWRHHETVKFSALLALFEGNPLVTCGFPSQRPVTQRFDVFFDLCLNKRLSTPWRRRWFGTPWPSLWRHCNALCYTFGYKSVL